MATESNQRMFKYLQTGCIDLSEGKETCKPMSFWTEQDVLKYIYENNLEIASVYGEVVLKDGVYSTTGANRTGCQVCLFGVHLEPQPNRLQLMSKENPSLHKYMIVDLGIGELLDSYNIPYK